MTTNNFPDELMQLPQRVGYKRVLSKTRPGKTDKFPVNPLTGELASTTDRVTWSSFTQAAAAVARYDLSGVGFVFSEDDPYTGIDLDACLHGDGLDPWAAAIVDRLDSYTEVTPSGTGLHIIVRAVLPPGGRRKGGIEMYDSGRFFTMTGNVWGAHASIAERQAVIEALHGELFPPKPQPARPINTPASPVILSDQEIIERAEGARNAAKFAALWRGDIRGYQSQSEADLALCSILGFWASGDAVQTDRLFRFSSLHREKWDKRHFADGTTYGQRTIALALGGLRDVYHGNGQQPPDDLMPDLTDPHEEPEPVALTGPMPKGPPERIPATVKPDLSECPPLPASAQLDPAVAAGAAPWLDDYIAFSCYRSPESWPGYHVNCGLGLLSTIAARRVAYHFGKERYTSLMLANIGRSSVWAKTTAAHVALDVLEAAGLSFLKVADNTTPQALVARMATSRVTENWADATPEQQDWAKLRLGFAGQQGWFPDEFGGHIAGMMKSDGPMGDFVSLLRVLDDGLQTFDADTISRGNAKIRRPYLALLVSFTPSDVVRWAGRGGSLWGNGFWARFAFSVPSVGARVTPARFPEGACHPPADLVQPLRQWHERLGSPDVQITERLGEEGAPLKKRAFDTTIIPPNPMLCRIGYGVLDAVYAYRDALRTLTEDFPTTDFDGNYARFHEKALRVAALLASYENGGAIELRHWARAQMIAEDWRASLHNLYAAVNSGDVSPEARAEERVLTTVGKLGQATPAEIRKYLPALAAGDIVGILADLTRAGIIEVAGTTHKGSKIYKTVESKKI